ncbi:SGNH/GDSL hydrolase family protein [Kocuria sp. M1R5S2]|uniref:SGNH/GDSL hydrolase family protein n=1 Tax=Kocuria rhizosphaerae TaxID=3376285 RepID=UPI0037B0C6FC
MRSLSLRRTAGAVATAVALVGATVSPATAAPSTVGVVNLGDSYSAAIGTGGISALPLPGPCLQGQGPDHVDKLDAGPRFDVRLDAACSGATTTQIRALAGLPAVGAALAGADLVTLTLGGNDLGWTQIVLQCSALGHPALCDTLLAQAPTAIDAAARSAGQTVATIDEATDGTILVFGYPRLFDAQEDSALMPAARAAQLNALTDQLNAALRSAVEAEGAVFVDVAQRFQGHGLGSADPWIHFDPADPFDPNSLHPTSRGYLSGYFPALMSGVSPGRLAR